MSVTRRSYTQLGPLTYFASGDLLQRRVARTFFFVTMPVTQGPSCYEEPELRIWSRRVTSLHGKYAAKIKSDRCSRPNSSWTKCKFLVVIILDTIRSIALILRAPCASNGEARLPHLLRIASASASIDGRICNHQNDRAQETARYNDSKVPPANDIHRGVRSSEDLRCSDTSQVGSHGDEGHAEGSVLGVPGV